MSSTCLAQDIHAINNTKEYTLMSTFLNETIMTDKNLIKGAAVLWQLLYNKAHFNQDLDITVSFSDMAGMIEKSTRTVKRYVKSLIDNGYLSVKKNYMKNGGKAANTISVRFPKESIEQAKLKKDRQAKPSAQNVTTPSDTCVTRKNNNISITNNKQPVVVEEDRSKDEQQEQARLEQEIKNLDEQVMIKQKILSQAEPADKNYDALHNLTQTMSKQDDLRRTLDKLKQKQQQRIEQQRIESKQRDPLYMAKMDGPRVIPEFTFKRLVAALKSYGYYGDDLNYMINELVCEIRYGSLSKDRKTKQELNIEIAVNIALKLVREGRWVTPREFKKMMES